MRVECPPCGQRMEVTGRQMHCPNCGQLCQVSHEFLPPLPPRKPKEEAVEELEEVVSGSGPQRQQKQPPPAPAYHPPAAEREFPAWVPATLLILALFVGLFILLYIGSLRLASYTTPPPAPAPVAP